MNQKKYGLRAKFTMVGILLGFLAFGQNLAGIWKGTLTQEGSSGQYTYELRLSQEGNSISGISVSHAPTGDSARFSLTGILDNGQLILQELTQMEPETPRWCLKYAELKLERQDNAYQLSGGWTADACKPGRITVRKAVTMREEVVTEVEPFTITGEWTGHLNQSDREYGFYYEIKLSEGGTGQSYIVSEGSGGSARHALTWRYDEATRKLWIEESRVVERQDPDWPWCIKSAAFSLRKADQRYVLEGDWQGFIEGYKGIAKGRCAAGSLILEKPIVTRQTLKMVADDYQGAGQNNIRAVKVERVLEVKSKDLQIRVWDNGTVDGDVVTLFINGRRLLYNYRVSKRKMTIPVTLDRDNNFLILHADDIGSISPNTVAVSVYDGVHEQTIILSSNLDFSGAVMIRRFRPE